ncbi:MAG: hypothetical protein ACKOXS_03530 [Actinomycetes bacterium]
MTINDFSNTFKEFNFSLMFKVKIIKKKISVDKFKIKAISLAKTASTSREPNLNGYSTFAPQSLKITKITAATDST